MKTFATVKPLYIWIWISLLFGLIACNAPRTIDKEIYIPVERSMLYLRLAGNAKAPIILMLHGGPGAFSGLDHVFYEAPVEPDYLVAYLDQRGSGKSPACPDSTLLNMNQFVKDLDIVVDRLRQMYPDRKINLLGTSWGGTYGLLYLLKHPVKINAFACVSGKGDSQYENEALIAYEMQLAHKKLTQTQDRATKDTLNQIVSKLTQIKNSSFDQFFADMNLIKHQFPKTLGFDPYWANMEAKQEARKLGTDSGYFAKAHYNLASFDTVVEKMEYVNRVFRNTPAYNHLNLLSQLSKIKTPVAVIQGELDHVVGPGQGQRIFDALTGLSKEKKEIHIIPGAAHNLNLEAPAAYYSTLKTFLAKYNP